jgi:hypothetical protein
VLLDPLVELSMMMLMPPDPLLLPEPLGPEWLAGTAARHIGPWTLRP